MKRLALFLTVLTVLFMAGCSDKSNIMPYEPEQDRFEVETFDETPMQRLDYFIITDTKTDVQYLFVDGYNSGGLAQLVQPEPEQAELTVEDWTDEAKYMARTAWGEGRGCTLTEIAAIYWCILDRADSPDPIFPDDIVSVITQPEQFHGYSADNPVDLELYELALDVIDRWQREKAGESDVGRVLPAEYHWFHGDGKHNHFRNTYEHTGEYWSWSLPSPYEEVSDG